MKKFIGLTALIVAFSLTFALFSGAFAMGFPKKIAAAQPAAAVQLADDGSVTDIVTDYLKTVVKLSFVKKIVDKVSGGVDPADIAVLEELIAKITGSIGK